MPPGRTHCGWRKSCITVYTSCPRNCSVLGVLSGARFAPSTVVKELGQDSVRQRGLVAEGLQFRV